MTARRFLCVAHDFPVPADNGSSVRVAGVLRLLSGLGEARLVVNPRSSTTDADIAAVRALGADLVLGESPHRPGLRGARLWARSVRQSVPPWFLLWYDERVQRTLDTHVPWATDVVALDDFAAQYLLRLPPTTARVVLDKHKVYAAPAARGGARAGVALLREPVLRRVVRANERATIDRADVVIVTSGEEDDRLRAAHGVAPTAVIPSAIDLPPRWQPTGAEVPTVLWLGTLDSRPNREGFLRLLDELRRLPQPPFRLRAVGRGADAELAAAARGLPVQLEGYVADLDAVIQASDAAVVPLWSGGGLRLKALALLGSGIPVIATPAALEGTGARHGEHCLVASSPSSLVALTVDALGDAGAGARGERARQLVAASHTWDARRPLLEAVVGHEVAA